MEDRIYTLTLRVPAELRRKLRIEAARRDNNMHQLILDTLNAAMAVAEKEHA